MPVELRFHAMGSDAHVIVVGGAPALAEYARGRIDALEHRWSRFRPDSEVSELNRKAGDAVRVSADTLALVRRALDAWKLTGGLFDPTVLGDVLRAGYDRSFDARVPFACAGSSDLALGAADVELDGDTVRLPAGTGFDPGGLGKGLAADLLVHEVHDRGAAGACVNLGGDVRVAGTGPKGDDWTIALNHPARPTPLARVGIRDGGVATSTTLRRRWHVEGQVRHHIIDPTTGRPSSSDITFASVVAGSAWAAEALATAIVLRGTPSHFDVLAETGAEAVAVDAHGCIDASFGFAHYLGHADLAATVQDVNA
jgi:thiamine biosynthesis lipoprotein